MSAKERGQSSGEKAESVFAVLTQEEVCNRWDKRLTEAQKLVLSKIGTHPFISAVAGAGKTNGVCVPLIKAAVDMDALQGKCLALSSPGKRAINAGLWLQD